jgi:hypothetical protein
MALKIPAPLSEWSPAYQIRVNQAVETNDLNNRKKGTDIELALAENLILRSPNGARWKITVSNAGVVAATAL